MKFQLIIKGQLNPQDLAKFIEVFGPLQTESKPKGVLINEEESPGAKFNIQHITTIDHVNFKDHPLEDAGKKNCKECGDEFFSRFAKTQFCSKKCYNKNYIEEQKIKKQITKDPEPTGTVKIPIEETRICQHPKCLKEFVPTRKSQLYCSKLCSSRGSVMLSALKKKNSVANVQNNTVHKTAEKKSFKQKESKHGKGETFYNGMTSMP